MTLVPPSTLPLTGLTAVMAGGMTKVKRSAVTTGEVPNEFVTGTSIVAVASAGLVAGIWGDGLIVNEGAAVAPNETPVAAEEFVPVMRTDDPPAPGRALWRTAVL